MLRISQIKNIYRFLFIFHNNMTHTNDYIIEKMNNLLGKDFKLKKNIRKKEIINDIVLISDNEISDIKYNLQLFFDKNSFSSIISKTLHNFNKYIGDVLSVQINETLKVHHLFEKNINIILKYKLNEMYINLEKLNKLND